MAGKHKQHTHEEKIEVAKRICDLYAANTFTIASCCEKEGITDHTFRVWKNEISEISDYYKEAKNANNTGFKALLHDTGKKSLLELVEGKEVTDSFIETVEKGLGVFDVNGKELFTTTTRKTMKKTKVMPNVTAVIFALTNSNDESDPVFLHQNRIEHTGKNGGEIQIRQLPEWMQETAGLKKEEEVKND
jgi:hypothetical protein